MWVGLALLHIALRARAQRDRRAACARSTRSWDDDRLYAKARLINSALMAKIHTVEWTPAIIGHPTTEKAIKATWYGLLGRACRGASGASGRARSCPASPARSTDHHGVPYSLTEEFVTVYRLHPLMPDEFTFGGEHASRCASSRSSPAS